MYSVAHVGVVVKNADKSSEFYTQVLGCEIAGSYQDDRIKLVNLRLNGQIIELVEHLAEKYEPRGNGAVDHIAFYVNDIDVAVARLKQLSVPLLFELPRDAGDKRIMFFTGPDGERLEFVEETKK